MKRRLLARGALVTDGYEPVRGNCDEGVWRLTLLVLFSDRVQTLFSLLLGQMAVVILNMWKGEQPKIILFAVIIYGIAALVWACAKAALYRRRVWADVAKRN